MPWYYAEGTQQGTERRGPLDDADFIALATSGMIRAATLVWQSGMAEWQPLAAVRPDLVLPAPLLREAPPGTTFARPLAGAPPANATIAASASPNITGASFALRAWRNWHPSILRQNPGPGGSTISIPCSVC